MQKRISVDNGSFFDNLGALAVDSNTGIVYVARFRDQLLYAVNPATGVIVKIKLSFLPRAIAINENTNMIYVGGEDSVSILNGFTNRLLTQYVETAPYYGDLTNMVVNSNSNVVYVVGGVPNAISVIDGSTNTLSQNVSFPTTALSMAINERTGVIYLGGQDGHVYQVSSGPISGGANVVSGAYGIVSDVFPPKILRGPNFEASDRVTITNYGTTAGVFLLETQFDPAINYSTQDKYPIFE